ncbi:copper transporter 5.1 [Pyrus ussuriensis x Pyrus communis]|uniref:Copper transport protein n=1 Tax=Pyrus ussuriensis x Pyrus communis TaxID=2448454 RepID=A0A5N5HMD7_9ROSA|nr:copper transporter 5.1 [Pyrus ussuriensis x Pyrus communis]
MMHMTFYWSRQVTLLFDSWKTDTWTSYSLTLLACLLVPAFYQYLENLRVRIKRSASSSSPKSESDAPIRTPLLAAKLGGAGGRFSAGRLAESVLFGVNSAIGYMIMLAIMSFNGGVFVAIVVGLAIGYLAFRSGDDEVAGAVVETDNPCACA